MFNLFDIRHEYMTYHSKEDWSEYLKDNFRHVYDVNLNFIGYERA